MILQFNKFKKYSGQVLDNSGKVDLKTVLTPKQKEEVLEKAKTMSFISMPEGITYYNGGESCDMIIGPCSCGAWHHGHRFGIVVPK